jgi:hypothetical protein
MAEEAYVYGKRGLFVWQKRPMRMAKEADYLRSHTNSPVAHAAAGLQLLDHRQLQQARID